MVRFSNRLKNFGETLLDHLNTPITLSIPLVSGAIGGVLIGYGLGVLANYDFSLAEQTQITYQAVRDYTEKGFIMGTITGAMIDVYILAKLFQERDNLSS